MQVTYFKTHYDNQVKIPGKPH